jgi:hypothetical protein
MPSFLLRMDSTAHQFFFYSALPIALHHYLRRCFTSWEGPDIACFSDAQSRSFTPRSLDPHGRAVGSSLLTFVRTSRRLARGQLYRLPTIRVILE